VAVSAVSAVDGRDAFGEQEYFANVLKGLVEAVGAAHWMQQLAMVLWRKNVSLTTPTLPRFRHKWYPVS
jgi:hypothetical protein